MEAGEYWLHESHASTTVRFPMQTHPAELIMHGIDPTGTTRARSRTAIRAVAALLLLPGVVVGQTTDRDDPALTPTMNSAQQDYGRPHPDAPRELQQFAFLIGRWECESRVNSKDGAWQTYPATRVGRYILITFSDISERGFHWQAEISTDDQETWELVQVIEAERVKD